MFTREKINEILEPWDSSIDERPSATEKQFAYDAKDRERAYVMAYEWCGVKNVIPSPSANQIMADFICHQSDVIEMLAHALSFANKKIEDQKDIIEIQEDHISILQEDD